MRLAGHVARMGRRGDAHRVLWAGGEMHTGFWWGNVSERGHLGGTVVYREIILKWIFRRSDVGHGLDLSGSWYGQVAGSCE